LFSTLFGFIVNLDLDLALRPLWKIFTSVIALHRFDLSLHRSLHSQCFETTSETCSKQRQYQRK
jgi:hypothetical protein